MQYYYREAPWSSSRAARLRCRKSPEGPEFEAGHRHPRTGKLCQLSSKRVPFFRIREGRGNGKRNGLRLSLVVPKIQVDSTPTAATAIGLREIFTSFTFNMLSKLVVPLKHVLASTFFSSI